MPEETNKSEIDKDPTQTGDPLRDWWDDLRTSAGFLTRLPIPLPGTSGSLAQASRTFPLVGALIGAAAALVYAIVLNLGLTAWLSAGLAVAAALILTGALHEDGLADLADGLGARGDAPARLAPMAH